MMKRIVVIGPESTGKSTLCEQLALHYDTLWCPEYAREYLYKFGTSYNFQDLLHIAKGQVSLEDSFIKMASEAGKNILFVDTDMYVMKVWSEFVFNKCHQYILEQINARYCDLYLLCNTDLPWVMEELREYPDPEPRQQLFNMYKDILVNQHVPWVEISGSYGERFDKALSAVQPLLNDNPT